MISIGVDPSMNSTGVCVMQCSGSIDSISTRYCMICSNPSKATEKFIHGNGPKFDYRQYKKLDYSSEKEYWKKEFMKTESMVSSAMELSSILVGYPPDMVVMEGVSYGSTSGSSIVDLAGLNFLYRYIITCHSADLVIASPMEIKKFATGNGGVDKDAMLKVWSMCERLDLDPKAKLDDLADAYFMALYGLVRLYPDLENSLVLPKIDIPKKKRQKKVSELEQSAMDNFNSI